MDFAGKGSSKDFLIGKGGCRVERKRSDDLDFFFLWGREVSGFYRNGTV